MYCPHCKQELIGIGIPERTTFFICKHCESTWTIKQTGIKEEEDPYYESI
jgi:transposase-like protein